MKVERVCSIEEWFYLCNDINAHILCTHLTNRHSPFIPSLALPEIIKINFEFFFNIPSNFFFAAVISPPLIVATEEASLALKLNRFSADDCVRPTLLYCTDDLLCVNAHTVAIVVDMAINTAITFMFLLYTPINQHCRYTIHRRGEKKMTTRILSCGIFHFIQKRGRT